jgi:aspartyl-tRNA(Asn)/glutamyl-tRNA(Gln) amidotransferase subunit A
LDTVGFLTNSVNDAEIIFEEITGKKVYELSPISLDGLVIYSCENGLTEDMDSSILSTYNHVISLIEEAGIVVKKRRFKEVDEILELSSRETNLITYEAYKNWNKFINDNPGLVPDYIVKRVMKGADISDEAISIYKEKVLKLKNRIIKELSDSVGFLMPTVAINPPVLEEVKTDEGLFFKNNRLALRNTRVANLLGLCSMTIPIKSYSKFPIGVMLNCEPFAETTLLRMARLIENATSGVDS